MSHRSVADRGRVDFAAVHGLAQHVGDQRLAFVDELVTHGVVEGRVARELGQNGADGAGATPARDRIQDGSVGWPSGDP
jgi:hypothetical protein